MYDTPFYAWSLSEAWEWLIAFPFLGFVFLVLSGLTALIAILLVCALITENSS